MAQTIKYSREIPVRYDVDVLVAGGGPAGCAAAWSASRLGAKVLLIEGQGALGGMGTLGNVPAFMEFGDGDKILARGFGRSVLTEAVKRGAVFPAKLPDDTRAMIPIRCEGLKRIYDDMALDAGVKLSFCTQMIDVQTDGGCVTRVICAAKSGVFAVAAKLFVDCTGDGDLCTWAGADYEKGDEEGNMMPGTLCSIYCNVSSEAIKASHAGLHEALTQAISDGIFSVPDLHLPGFFYLGGGVGGGNISHAFGLDATDEQSLTHHFIDSRKRLAEYEMYYKKYFKGFDDMQLVVTGSLFGVRETRRIVCDARLELKHFQSRATFGDEIGRYCYPVDIHISKPDVEQYKKFEKEYNEDFRYQKGESYGVPYGCLIPRKLRNVLVAGRCISCDRYIQGSIRVMPGCFITGQAAGIAAAKSLGLNNDPRKVSASAINEVINSFDDFN